MTWCWHPMRTVTRQPLPTDYRCCCGCCTSKCGFTALTIINIVGLCLSFFGRFPVAVESTKHHGLGGYYTIMLPLGLQVLLLLLCVLALKTEKPVWMQIFWTIQLINGIIVACFMIFMLGTTFLLIAATEERDQQRAAAGVLIPLIFMLLICGAYLAWYLSLIYSYYSYLRDKQLWLEQNGVQMSQIQVEAQPMYPKLVDEAPPPYQVNQLNYPRQV